jgi:hypothetical protein
MCTLGKSFADRVVVHNGAMLVFFVVWSCKNGRGVGGVLEYDE